MKDEELIVTKRKQDNSIVWYDMDMKSISLLKLLIVKLFNRKVRVVCRNVTVIYRDRLPKELKKG